MNAEERKAYRRNWMAKKRACEQKREQGKLVNKSVNNSVNKPDIDLSVFDLSVFDSKGRGVPVGGYVLVSLGAVAIDKPECVVIPEQVWRDRLDIICGHGLKGWACKQCV